MEAAGVEHKDTLNILAELINSVALLSCFLDKYFTCIELG